MQRQPSLSEKFRAFVRLNKAMFTGFVLLLQVPLRILEVQLRLAEVVSKLIAVPLQIAQVPLFLVTKCQQVFSPAQDAAFSSYQTVVSLADAVQLPFKFFLLPVAMVEAVGRMIVGKWNRN